MHNTIIQQIGELSQEVMHHPHNCLMTKPTFEAELEQTGQNDIARVHSGPNRMLIAQNSETDQRADPALRDIRDGKWHETQSGGTRWAKTEYYQKHHGTQQVDTMSQDSKHHLHICLSVKAAVRVRHINIMPSEPAMFPLRADQHS